MKEELPQLHRPTAPKADEGQHSVPVGSRAKTSSPRQYFVLNLTDGIAAHPVFMTLSSAKRLVRQFPRRFLGQGSYITAERDRVQPDDVTLAIVEADLKTARSYADIEPDDFA
jgi:hypothetical protein